MPNRAPNPANTVTARGLAAKAVRADTTRGPRPEGTIRDPRPATSVDPTGLAALADPVDLVDLVDLVARDRAITTRPGAHRRPIRAGAASMTAGAITSRSTTTGAG